MSFFVVVISKNPISLLKQNNSTEYYFMLIDDLITPVILSIHSRPNNTHRTQSDKSSSLVVLYFAKFQTIRDGTEKCYCKICEEFHEANALTSTSCCRKTFTHTLTQFHQLFGILQEERKILVGRRRLFFSHKSKFFEWLIREIGYLLYPNTSAPRWDTQFSCNGRKLYSYSMNFFLLSLV